MNPHPLFQELKEICCEQNLNIAKAQLTFEAYQELSEVKNLFDLKYFFSDELNFFYITGKTEKIDENPNVYVPMLSSEKMSPKEMNHIQLILNPTNKKFNLLIRDRDSTSTCYCVTKGLIEPDCLEACKRKKDFELKKSNFEKTLFSNRKLIFSKALKQQKLKELPKN